MRQARRWARGFDRVRVLPLRREQLLYAALDAHILLDVHTALLTATS